jgi:hypothetical protein
VKVGSDEIVQIEKAAFGVIDDPRFNTNMDIQWDFWVVSDELAPMPWSAPTPTGCRPG